MKISVKFFLLGLILVSIQFFVFQSVSAQTKKQKSGAGGGKPPVIKKAVNSNLPKVTRIDAAALKSLLKPAAAGANTKPLLINFWATWCDPCREEFPDLVKIDSDYKDKINFITISLDELSEIKLEVPKFLASMNATMPAYLLKTDDEDAAIALVSKDWQGGLPFTILFNEKGETVYSKQGKIKPEVLRAELDKLALNSNSGPPATQAQIIDLPRIIDTRYTFENGKLDAQKDVAEGKLIIKRYGLTAGVAPEQRKKLKEKYGVEIADHGCIVSNGFIDYVKGYNEISALAIKRKLGTKATEILGKL